MSDEEDQGEDKTEEPTERKLEKEKEEGHAPFSKEIVTLGMLCTIALSILYVLPWSCQILAQKSIPFLTYDLDPLEIKAIGWHSYKIMLMVLGPTFLLLYVGALSGGLLQKWGAISLKSMAPKLSNLSLKKGIKRIFSVHNLVENIKNIFKLTVLLSVLYVALSGQKENLERWLWLTFPEAYKVIHKLNVVILVSLIVAFGFIAVFDYFYQRFEHLKKLRMTPYDIKQEHKETDGNPEVKQKLRQIRLKRANKPMMAEVPKATVVITNPTHYAIALKWEEDSIGAPVVIAMGMDSVAERIRQVARDNAIPVIENPPLTRALYEVVDLDQEIPPKFYKAVADVIRLVLDLKKRKIH